MAHSVIPSVADRRAALEVEHPSWVPATLAGALDAAAARYADRPLLLGDDRTLSYAEVRAWVRRLAAGLIGLGIAPGEHVALVLANSPELIALKFAIAEIGAVAVPINYLLRAQELGYIIGQSDAVALVTMRAFRDLDYVAALEQLGGAAAFPALREVIVIDGPGSLDGLEAAGDADARRELERREAGGDPHGLADIIYTSGTTGAPKGVMLSHDALLRSGYGSAYTRALGDGQRIVFALPLYHVFSYVEALLAGLYVGGGLIAQAQFSPVATLEAIERHRADEALFVPTMTIAVLEAARAGDYDLSSLRSVMSAAAPAPVRLWEAVRDEMGVTEVVTAYGMTECSAASTYTEPDGPLELVSTTVGVPKAGGVAGLPELGGRLCEYRTRDPLSGAWLPDGSEGELVGRGPIFTTGYYAKPEETAAVLDSDGWLRSGDLGRVTAEGLKLTGRSKELYKCGGELVAPTEVEAVLSGHPAVAQAYVVGLPDERMGEVGCAWVVTRDGSVDAEALLAHCRERLARFKVPRHILTLAAEELPTTATGKVQKFMLVERARTRLADPGP